MISMEELELDQAKLARCPFWKVAIAFVTSISLRRQMDTSLVQTNFLFSSLASMWYGCAAFLRRHAPGCLPV